MQEASVLGEDEVLLEARITSGRKESDHEKA